MTRVPPRNPLVAIVGSTGTGKSQLAVEIAKRYNGEIINGDAMQLYAGLPIITNKITAEEQQGVPHHLLGCIGLEEQTWVVGMFVRRALKTIEEIRSRGRVPILVGGTHYYTQSLLFHDRLAEQEEDAPEKVFEENPSDRWPVLQEPTEVLLAELSKVDPVMANRWHPNDRRKIQRSLEIFLQTGRRASDIYAEQRRNQGAVTAADDDKDPTSAESTQEMRFPTLIFWVHSETDALRQRLDERVDRMLAAGLLDEVRTLHAFAAAQTAAGQPVDETRGIWVSIGYKEFLPYVDALTREPPTDPPAAAVTSTPKKKKKKKKKEEEELQLLQRAAVERTRIATRQYAKRQLRWLRIKFRQALAHAGPRATDACFVLDGSDLAAFQLAGVAPALECTGKFLRAEPLPPPRTLCAAAETLLMPAEEEQQQQQQQQRGRGGDDWADTVGKWGKWECASCGTTCVTAEQWQAHVKSKAHRKRASAKRRVDEHGQADGPRKGEEAVRSQTVSTP